MTIRIKDIRSAAHKAEAEAEAIVESLKTHDEWFLFTSCREGRHNSILSPGQQDRLCVLTSCGLVSKDSQGWWYPTPMGRFVLDFDKG